MDKRDQELDLWKVNKIDKPLSRLIKKGRKMRNVSGYKWHHKNTKDHEIMNDSMPTNWLT